MEDEENDSVPSEQPMMEMMAAINSEKKSSSEVDEEPPSNGVWYCSLCNWVGSMYDRFDSAFVTFFITQNINHGMWIIATLAVKDYYKDYLGLDPGEM